MGLNLFTGTKWNEKYLKKINPRSIIRTPKDDEIILNLFKKDKICSKK